MPRTCDLAVESAAKCLPVSSTLSADKYSTASCCLEGVERSKSQFLIEVDFEAEISECPTGWKAGIYTIAVRVCMCGLAPERHWIISSCF